MQTIGSPILNIMIRHLISSQPRPQGFSLKKWKSRGDEVDSQLDSWSEQEK